jgi:transcription initiation factor IIE alpha subunit
VQAICIRCWNPEAVVVMNLVPDANFTCNDCGEDFTCADVREQLNAMQSKWAKLLAWAEAYPKGE